MQPLQICIGPIIRIGRESWCLPYAGFLNTYLEYSLLSYTPIYYTAFYSKQVSYTPVSAHNISSLQVLALYYLISCFPSRNSNIQKSV